MSLREERSRQEGGANAKRRGRLGVLDTRSELCSSLRMGISLSNKICYHLRRLWTPRQDLHSRVLGDPWHLEVDALEKLSHRGGLAGRFPHPLTAYWLGIDLGS